MDVDPFKMKDLYIDKNADEEVEEFFNIMSV